MRALVLVAVASLGVSTISCTGPSDHEHPFPANNSNLVAEHGAVTRLQLVPIPEGPVAPSFDRSLGPNEKLDRPLSTVSKYMPDAFPAPLEQPANCDSGGNLVVTFADGFQLTYGPCRRPASINRLWAGMEYVLSNGRCAPNCGPGGLPGP